MSNDGQGRFQLEFGTSTEAQTFSVAAADFDLDGDLDVYVCGYNPTASTLRRGVMGEPMPYHDANNGGRNLLLRNDGNWLFTDATSDVGLDQNNSRFSFAASWEDYDNDGDPDLYVANDYGRNNLYQNNDGTFVDVGPNWEWKTCRLACRPVGRTSITTVGWTCMFPTCFPLREIALRTSGNSKQKRTPRFANSFSDMLEATRCL
ncbi:MAG: VCBS repeat-containing protein [Pirellulaceae bacterium]